MSLRHKTPAALLLILFGLFGSLMSAPARSHSTWDALSGLWQLYGDSGVGSQPGSDWGEVVSRSWYGDFDFSGSVSRPTAAASDVKTAILVRYAANTECYKLVLDWAEGRASLVENHCGESRQLDSVSADCITRGIPIRFRATASGAQLTITLCSDDVSLSYSKMLIPGGRVGLGVHGGEVKFSELSASGSAAAGAASAPPTKPRQTPSTRQRAPCAMTERPSSAPCSSWSIPGPRPLSCNQSTL